MLSISVRLTSSFKSFLVISRATPLLFSLFSSFTPWISKQFLREHCSSRSTFSSSSRTVPDILVISLLLVIYSKFSFINSLFLTKSYSCQLPLVFPRFFKSYKVFLCLVSPAFIEYPTSYHQVVN